MWAPPMQAASNGVGSDSLEPAFAMLLPVLVVGVCAMVATAIVETQQGQLAAHGDTRLLGAPAIFMAATDSKGNKIHGGIDSPIGKASKVAAFKCVAVRRGRQAPPPTAHRALHRLAVIRRLVVCLSPSQARRQMGRSPRW